MGLKKVQKQGIDERTQEDYWHLQKNTADAGYSFLAFFRGVHVWERRKGNTLKRNARWGTLSNERRYAYRNPQLLVGNRYEN